MVKTHTYMPSLKLVVDNLRKESTEIIEKPISIAEQLSLPLGDEPIVTLVHQSQLNREIFITIIDFHRPKWIYDARTSPRLDTVVGSRRFAFDLFEQFHINYLAVIDTLIRRGECLDGDNWTSILAKHIETSGDYKSNSVIILDDTYQYDEISAALRNGFESFIPKNQNIDFIQYNS